MPGIFDHIKNCSRLRQQIKTNNLDTFSHNTFLSPPYFFLFIVTFFAYKKKKKISEDFICVDCTKTKKRHLPQFKRQFKSLRANFCKEKDKRQIPMNSEMSEYNFYYTHTFTKKAIKNKKNFSSLYIFRSGYNISKSYY